MIGGSVIITAVAGTVLGATNDPATFDENTEITFDPGIPAVSEDTSDATTGF